MVAAPEDLEGALVAPVVVPGVGHQPVGRVLLHAPAQQSDGVAPQGLAAGVLVHAALVVGEVLEHREGGLRGAVGHKLDLDLLDAVPDGVALLAEALVLVVGHRVLGVVAGAVTLGGGAALRTRAPGAIDMVLAGLDDIRLAALTTAG